jgi:hypothetical protein
MSLKIINKQKKIKIQNKFTKFKFNKKMILKSQN